MLEENIKIYDQTMEEKHHEKKEIEVIFRFKRTRINSICDFYKDELANLREEANTLM